MNQEQQKHQAKLFAQRWSNPNHKESGKSEPFWIDLVEHVFGVKNGADYIDFEKSIPNANKTTDYIDAYIPATKVLIEQKRPNVDLNKKYQRSFGKVTPFEQAQHYANCLSNLERPDKIITCNFSEFLIYDMNESGNPTPHKLLLKDLPNSLNKLRFLVDPNDQDADKVTTLSKNASYIITDIYDSFLKQYNSDDPDTLRDLNKLCVRLVFCFYADFSGIFGKPFMFKKYLISLGDVSNWRRGLISLFDVLDTKPKDRDPYDSLNRFAYVNGGLFKDKIEIPQFTNHIKYLILHEALRFDWSQISPTIFGAMFESTLSPKERHKNGMHYTSIKNIHKVIDPLFLNHYKRRLKEIEDLKYRPQKQTNEAETLQHELSSLTFLDPACGSGNFLTETYLCLRRLENKLIEIIHSRYGVYQGILNLNNMDLKQHKIIQVSIKQFYGIEINDFAVSVAKTAMWIAESQMYQETQTILNGGKNFLPLKTYTNIHEGNALTINWNHIINANDLDYIISNPPYSGDKKTKAQKADMKRVMDGFKSVGKLDLVTAWFKKSADMLLENQNIEVSLVATNSIVEGQQVVKLWQPLIKKYKIHINYAFEPFKWVNYAKKPAQVYCVIIGMGLKPHKQRALYINDQPHFAQNISPYLKALPDILVKSKSKPISKYAPIMRDGSKPTDDKGKLCGYSNKDKADICAKYPSANKLFKKFIWAHGFTHNEYKWCLWLKYSDPKDWLKIKPIKDNVHKVRIYRENSSDSNTNKSADIPYLFQADRQPHHKYLLIPRVTSGKRKYVPIGYMSKDVIINDSCLYIDNASYYMFGVLSSRIHMIWVALVSGRLKMDYRYSARISYNTFPFIKANNTQKESISNTAKAIIKARSNHPNDSLDTLYNPDGMPLDLLKAHRANDKAVAHLYGFKVDANKDQIINKLLLMYAGLVKNQK